MNVFDILRDKLKQRKASEIDLSNKFMDIDKKMATAYANKALAVGDVIELVNQVEHELGNPILCYLGSPCEYQTEDVNHNHGWVDCSERFPEKNIFVLVSMRDGHMYVAKHVDKVRVGIFECEWKTLGSYFGTEDVLAWRPLPSPYIVAE